MGLFNPVLKSIDSPYQPTQLLKENRMIYFWKIVKNQSITVEVGSPDHFQTKYQKLPKILLLTFMGI